MRLRQSPVQPADRPNRPQALFTQTAADRYRSSDLTAGPWDKAAQHGSPVAALLLYCMQSQEDAADLPIARVTVELLRPVPVAELVVRARIRRPGKRVQLLEAEMRHDDQVVALGSAWGIAGNETAVSGASVEVPPPPRATGEGITVPQLTESGFHRAAVEASFVSGGFLEPGPATGWIRLIPEVVAGQPVTPAQRALVAADFGNGFSATVDPALVSFINPDLTLYLSGTPIGEWIGIASTTYSNGEGFGYAESVVFDETRAIGRAVQSLLFQARR